MYGRVPSVRVINFAKIYSVLEKYERKYRRRMRHDMTSCASNRAICVSMLHEVVRYELGKQLHTLSSFYESLTGRLVKQKCSNEKSVSC